MVVVEFLYEDMKKLTGMKKEKIVEGLTEIGAPCEFEKETKKILAELTPNRPDWYSMEGLARALKSYYNKERPIYSVKKSDLKVVVDKSVGGVRPCSVCAVVKGLQFTEERIVDMVLLQEKLLATLGRRVKRFGIGIYPMHAIKFPVKYTMMEPEKIRYHPLNYPHEASAKEILEKHPKGEEYGDLIKDLLKYPVFLDSDGKIMALLPIVNSQETGKVDLDTKDVFIEVTGIDMNACKAALNILVCTFADMGGTVHSVEMEYPTEKFSSPDLVPKKMKLDIDKVNGLLGMDLKKDDVVAYLERMGYSVKGKDVYIPPYRADVIDFVDVIEDIAIAHGYNNFEPTTADFFSPGKADRSYAEVDEIMKGMGFVETDTFILTNEDKLNKIGYKSNKTILNPSGEEFTAIRPTLLADMLDTFLTNKTKGVPQKFYEIGYVFTDKTKKKLAFGIMDIKLEFSIVRGHLQTLMNQLGLKFSLEHYESPLFDKEKGVSVAVDGKKIGVFGKVDKKLVESLGLGFEIYVCELQLR
jgi:phenylalanyl-tRNA synthetase beta chain